MKDNMREMAHKYSGNWNINEEFGFSCTYAADALNTNGKRTHLVWD